MKIYHTYKDEFSDIPLTFWYSTSETAGPDSEFEFDVRDLPGYQGRGDRVDDLENKRVIEAAIDLGLLRSDTPFTEDDNA